MSSECPLVILDISRLCRRLFYISHHHCELARGLPAYKAVDLQPQPVTPWTASIGGQWGEGVFVMKNGFCMVNARPQGGAPGKSVGVD